MTTVPSLSDFISPAKLKAIILAAREEDLGPDHDDITSRLFVPASTRKERDRFVLSSRSPGRLCGAALLPTIAACYDRRIKVQVLRRDGALLKPGTIVARFTGPTRSILTMERVALNFATHLSGIATLTARYVAAVSGTHARPRICDTRKTIPGLRALEKYAVVCGGGLSHRMGLYDAVLVKDNHIAHIKPAQLGAVLAKAIAKARALGRPPAFIEVEVDTLAQLEAILGCVPRGRPDMVLLDNMPPAMLKKAVALRNRQAPGVLLEASGGVNLSTVAAIAATGVDRISVGALTHSAPALDLGLDAQ
jgi:nicotinate-nucleotide pyrophosphorylase (carboxylating)